MENLTLLEWIGGVLAIAAAVNTIGSAIEKIVKAIKTAKNPNEIQNTRLDALEQWRADVDRRLVSGSTHFDAIDEGNRVTQTALLALLAHGIDGNNIDQMRSAKQALEAHLINR